VQSAELKGKPSEVQLGGMEVETTIGPNNAARVYGFIDLVHWATREKGEQRLKAQEKRC
jgi:hypothetical protein